MTDAAGFCEGCGMPVCCDQLRAVIDAAREWSTHVVHFRDTGTGYLNVVGAAQAVIDTVRALDGDQS